MAKPSEKSSPKQPLKAVSKRTRTCPPYKEMYETEKVENELLKAQLDRKTGQLSLEQNFSSTLSYLLQEMAKKGGKS